MTFISEIGPTKQIDETIAQVFRHELSGKGYALFQTENIDSSYAFRRYLTEFKTYLSDAYHKKYNRSLEYYSLGRFNQQVSTKFHYDGSPDHAVLILGYEPTKVHSKIAVADITKCSFDLGLEPKEFMVQHNVMFGDGSKKLEQYTTVIHEGSIENYLIVVINNSKVPYSSQLGMNGLLHLAEIPKPNLKEKRVINSLILSDQEESMIGHEQLEKFIYSDFLSSF